jgi:hypothetical protein
MKGLYRAHRMVIERLYEDRASISRYGEYTDPHTTETKLGLFSVYENVPCRLSRLGMGTNRQTETVNEIAYETKLFIAPEYDVKQGDVIEVTRGTVKRVYKAGEPVVYSTHQEVSLQREANA